MRERAVAKGCSQRRRRVIYGGATAERDMITSVVEQRTRTAISWKVGVISGCHYRTSSRTKEGLKRREVKSGSTIGFIAMVVTLVRGKWRMCRRGT